MFVATSTRTMANAHPKFRQLEEQEIQIQELKTEIVKQRQQHNIAMRQRDSQERQMARLLGDKNREIEALQALLGKDMLAQYMRRTTKFQKTLITFDTIEKRVCRVFQLSPAQLYAPIRDRHRVRARQCLTYWARRMTPLSLTQIGKKFGGIDHTTVKHSIAKWAEVRAKQGRNLREVR